MGYVILGLFLAVVIGGGGTYLGIFLKRRKQWDWPEGKRIGSASFDSKGRSYVCHFVYDDESAAAFKHTVTVNANRCAKSAAIVADVARELHINGEVPSNFAVHVVNSATYDKVYDGIWGSRSNGMKLDMSTKMGGRTMPLLACRLEGFLATEENGELVIHELIHALAGDGGHTNANLWGYPDGIEGRAVAKFIEAFGAK